MMLQNSKWQVGSGYVMSRKAIVPSRVAHKVQQHVPSSSIAAPQNNANDVVQAILKKIDNTDSGLAISEASRAEIDSMVAKLEESGKEQQPKALDNPLLFGNYNVAYTSIAKSSDRGEPAGGRFRNPIGRSLFRTTGLFQSVVQPDIVTNKVSFRLFGVIPGYVGLRGKVLPEGDSRDTVRVLFEPPVFRLGSLVTLKIGVPSSVVLTTPYLDERVRIGVGSRGSRFVFTRGGAADAAAMEMVGLEKTSPLGKFMLFLLFGTFFSLGAFALTSGILALKVVGAVTLLLTAAAAFVLRRGGIEDGEQSSKEYKQYMKQEDKAQEKAPSPAPSS